MICNTDFETIEEGMKELEDELEFRNSMCGAMYYNIINDKCTKIANKLLKLGANRESIESLINSYGGGIE